jgi:spore maturation protein SpmA
MKQNALLLIKNSILLAVITVMAVLIPTASRKTQVIFIAIIIIFVFMVINTILKIRYFKRKRKKELLIKK